MDYSILLEILSLSKGFKNSLLPLSIVLGFFIRDYFNKKNYRKEQQKNREQKAQISINSEKAEQERHDEIIKNQNISTRNIINEISKSMSKKYLTKIQARKLILRFMRYVSMERKIPFLIRVLEKNHIYENQEDTKAKIIRELSEFSQEYIEECNEFMCKGIKKLGNWILQNFNTKDFYNGLFKIIFDKCMEIDEKKIRMENLMKDYQDKLVKKL